MDCVLAVSHHLLSPVCFLYSGFPHGIRISIRAFDLQRVWAMIILLSLYSVLSLVSRVIAEELVSSTINLVHIITLCWSFFVRPLRVYQ